MELEYPDTAITLSNLAQVYRAQDRYNEAEDLLQRDLHILEKVLEPTDPSIATTLDELGGHFPTPIFPTLYFFAKILSI